MRQVLLQFQATFNEQLQEQFQQFRALKDSLIVTVEYQNTRFRNNEPFYMYLRSKLHLLYQRAEIPEAMKEMNEQLTLTKLLWKMEAIFKLLEYSTSLLQ